MLSGQMRARAHRKTRVYADLSKPHEDVTLEVHLPQDRMRLDVFLSERLAWRSRTKIQAMIEGGEVLVNGAAATKASQRVLHRDTVLVRVPKTAGPLGNDEVPLRPIYEDRKLLALDKPAGVVCHPVGKIRYGTLVNALHARYRRPEDPALDLVPRLCHRLDRDTSGIILVALAPGVRKRMQWIFESKKVVKEYLAIVEGVYGPDHEIIDLPIGRDLKSHLRIAQGVDLEAGLPAMTVVNVEERFPAREGDRGFTLLRASPITGRQHQIRVHVAARGHPVLGDTMYGPLGLRFPGWPAPPAVPILKRHGLHAFRIQVPHPITGDELDLRAPLPDDMAGLLDFLRRRSGY